MTNRPAGHRMILSAISKGCSGRKKLDTRGRWDPIATGVLTICVNEAQPRLHSSFQMMTNEYCATMLLGVRTDTLDIEGEILERCQPHFQTGEIEDAISRFVGRIEQRVPKYSAVKFRGKPLYKWTRQGFDIEPPVRSVDVHHINVEEIRIPLCDFLPFPVRKVPIYGHFVADIGDTLGCGACLSSLRRTRSGCFDERECHII